MVIGFYDGFIGPGAGSFLVIAFIVLLGFDFLHASAHAKLVNLATNLGSICLFLIKGKMIIIRIFFLVVVAGTLILFGYDVLMNR